MWRNKSRPAFASKPLIYYQIRTRHSQTFSRFGKQSKALKKKEHKMSEDAKRSVPGALSAKPNSDDRKPSPAVTTATGKRVIIKSADMFQDMQKEAVDIAIGAFEKHSVEKDVAEYIKKEFDKRHGPTWHCIVGRCLNSRVENLMTNVYSSMDPDFGGIFVIILSSTFRKLDIQLRQEATHRGVDLLIVNVRFCYLNPVEHGCHVGKDGDEKNDEPEIETNLAWQLH
ncbi:Dynein light chain type 1 family protein [Prunus dulcis]|uniref:Dynein light chain 1, cytoplasmic n=1 Tax=Prunus dulcis TaxID=3755 RepID=A0A4Y1QMR5_PRUDU|nr:Dynein light chain type 1 family protein [Prunus dulcis]